MGRWGDRIKPDGSMPRTDTRGAKTVLGGGLYTGFRLPSSYTLILFKKQANLLFQRAKVFPSLCACVCVNIL
jgi:hypothetical protein